MQPRLPSKPERGSQEPGPHLMPAGSGAREGPRDGQCLLLHHRARPTAADTRASRRGPAPKCRPHPTQTSAGLGGGKAGGAPRVWAASPSPGQRLGCLPNTRKPAHTRGVLQARPGGARATRAPRGPGWPQLWLGAPAGCQGPGLPAPSLALRQLHRSLAAKEHGRGERSLQALPPRPRARETQPPLSLEDTCS